MSGTEPVGSNSTGGGSRICTSCNVRRPIHQFRRYSKNSDTRRPHCNACHSHAEFQRKYDPLPQRTIPDGHKRCRGCKKVLPLEQFSKSGRGYRRAECNACRSEAFQRQRKRDRRKKLQEWMGKVHKYRHWKNRLAAFVDEAVWQFGGVENLAAELKDHYDEACKENPGGRYRLMTLRTIVELATVCNQARAAENQEQRQDIRERDTEDLENELHVVGSRLIADNPKLAVVAAMKHPELVQREFQRHGWTLEPPGND